MLLLAAGLLRYNLPNSAVFFCDSWTSYIVLLHNAASSYVFELLFPDRGLIL